jgi:1-acyl-sn-glycerol-3-phosphate acyltransferase
VHETVPAPARDGIQGVVKDAVSTLFRELHHAAPPISLEPRSRLDADLGFDSLARVELLERLERTLKIELPEEALASIETIADLLNVVTAAPKALEASAAASATFAPIKRSPEPWQGGQPTSAATLTQVLAWRVARAPDALHAIVLHDGAPEALSYSTLLSRAETIAAGLKQLGLSRDATVALMLPTSVDYLEAFFGVLLAGAIPVPLYPPAHRTQLEEHVHRHAEILSNADAEVVITFREVRLVAHLLKSRAPRLRHILSVAELAPRGTGARRAEGSLSAASGDSTALLQYTSGSTGSPKGVVLTHAHLLANIRAMGAAISATDKDVFVSWLPLYHDMGLIGAWLGSLYYGCLLVLMPPTAFLARPARWLRAVHDYRGTLSASPNFGYELAARRVTDEELKGLDLSCLRVLFNGAEPVHPETLDRFRQRFAQHGFRPEAMTPVYGLAEVGVGLTFPPADRGPVVDRVGREELARRGLARPEPPRAPDAVSFVSCGAPLPGYRLRIVDEQGTAVAERVEGNLQFAGPSATKGYYRNEEATAHLLSGEWRNSGDRAYVATGELYITGRAKDIIIRRGRHLYPEEIESAVGELAGVRKGGVAAFGTTDQETGTERLILVAETAEADPARRRELNARITECVTAAASEPADEIILAAPHSVLKTSSGKLRRAATRQAYLEGSLGRAVRNPALQMLRLLLESANLAVRRWADRLVRVAFGGYAWCLVLVIGGCAIALTMLLRDAPRIWRLNHRAARLLLHMLHMPPVVEGRERIDLRTAHVIVANHSSYADGVFVSALLREPHRFVAKAELDRAPLFGGYLRKLQTLFVERFVPGQSIADVGRVREALRRGDSVIVLPEGTFTREVGLRPFHLGAFQAAVAAPVPVVPLALKGTRSVLRDGERLPRRMRVEAVFGEPLAARPDEEPFAAAVRLRDEARAFIAQHCGEPDLGG